MMMAHFSSARRLPWLVALSAVVLIGGVAVLLR
jgi:hypothetical protein